jgi:hypothetical protein
LKKEFDSHTSKCESHASPTSSNSLNISGVRKRTSELLDMQLELRKTCYVRPYDQQKTENCAIKLCDTIIELDEYIS